MNKQEFIGWLERHGVTYVDATDKFSGQATVYVYGEEEILNSGTNYVPYIRVSWHDDVDEEFVYTRHNGLCGYKHINNVKEIILNGCK